MFLLLFFLPIVLADYNHLIRPLLPCTGHPSQWNCVQIIPKQFYEIIGTTNKYGWIDGEERGSRELTDLWDRGYNHTSEIPQFATNYMVLEFPEELLEIVEWYRQERKHSITNHDLVPGNYINDADSPLSKLNLDYRANARIRNLIKKVVKPMLAWWAEEAEDDLLFTSLFGVREYHKQSMMLMHADRHTTHHLSAVIHLFQKSMNDGWPLAIEVGDVVLEIFCSKPCLIFYVSFF